MVHISLQIWSFCSGLSFFIAVTIIHLRLRCLIRVFPIPIIPILSPIILSLPSSPPLLPPNPILPLPPSSVRPNRHQLSQKHHIIHTHLKLPFTLLSPRRHNPGQHIRSKPQHPFPGVRVPISPLIARISLPMISISFLFPRPPRASRIPSTPRLVVRRIIGSG